MGKPCKAILIDPFACEVREVDLTGEFEQLYKLLSHETMKVDTFTTVNLGNPGNDAIFVDDEGLLKPCERFFMWNGYPQPLAGKGLILGADDEGETISPYITVAEVRHSVTFIEVVAGVLSAIGAFVIFVGGSAFPAFCGALMAALALTMLFFGQRVAKDYAGAAVLVNYFLLALVALYLFR